MRPAVVPLPPLATEARLPWDAEVDDAVAVIEAARARHGDTFVVDSGRDRWVFTFSATGIDSFYALPEEDASKGVADFLMLRRKVPEEVFLDRRILPGTLFGVGDTPTYLARLEEALDRTVEEAGPQGRLDVFDLTRRIAHRMGLASWGGPGSADGAAFDALVEAFDRLDGAESFVHPDRMRAVAASGHAAEWAALAVIEEHLGSAVDRALADPGTGLFDRIVAAWAAEEPAVRARGVARDVALIHIASMSNLAAALGWAFIDVLTRPAVADAVRDGDDALAAAAVRESTRLAQRSLMARAVLRPLHLDVGDAVLAIEPGAFVATLLPVTNRDPSLGHDRWDADRWVRHRFADTAGLTTPRAVTAFGHGRHSCPAQPFAVTAMSTALRRLLTAWDVEPCWSGQPRPVPAQIGGVARAADPCEVRYRRRGDDADPLGTPR